MLQEPIASLLVIGGMPDLLAKIYKTKFVDSDECIYVCQKVYICLIMKFISTFASLKLQKLLQSCSSKQLWIILTQFDGKQNN